MVWYVGRYIPVHRRLTALSYGYLLYAVRDTPFPLTRSDAREFVRARNVYIPNIIMNGRKFCCLECQVAQKLKGDILQSTYSAHHLLRRLRMGLAE